MMPVTDGTGRVLHFPPYRLYQRWRRRSILEPLIAGQRVLIAGTGPSAAELGAIPEDVRVFTCKDGLALFADRRERRRIDLYACIRSRLLHESRLVELFERTRPRVFMSNDLWYIKRRAGVRGLYTSLVYDSGDDNAIVHKLIHPLSVHDIRGTALRAKISSGMRLLQYAVYYGAREIYLIGIDLGRSGYVWGRRAADRPWNHADIDENFIKTVASRHDNIFTMSSASPIAAYVPCRRLV